MSVGQKLKVIRQKSNITIPQLADMSGLSRGFISQVENDKASLSLESLQRIASSLKIPVSSFLDNEQFPAEVIKKDARPRIRYGNEPEIELLSTPFGRQLQIMMVELPPGYQAGNCAHSHEGEEWLMVLSGTVKVSQGIFSACLEEGDSIHWDGKTPHLCQNAGDVPAKIITALSPPTMLPVSKIE